VLNLVHGPSREITGELLSHPAVRVVSFTGSTGVGSSIMEQASRRIVRPLLELGGNAPFIVFEDADLDTAIEGALVAKLRNTGQSCVGANRFLVHESVLEEFGNRLAQRFDALTIGHGVPAAGEPVPDVGPVISQQRVGAVQAMIDEALGRGGRLLTQRSAVPPGGSYLAPTLLTDVPDSASIIANEVFGPAAAISGFGSDEEALRRANNTEMGLASYIWTQSPDRIWKFAEQLDAGIVGVNDAVPSVAFAPMGGTKQSGLGREGGTVGMEEFQETRYIAWR
jgi:succinate-semialdehyde dehydrogenase / glutarate-semialdehyde dehydrogenase